MNEKNVYDVHSLYGLHNLTSHSGTYKVWEPWYETELWTEKLLPVMNKHIKSNSQLNKMILFINIHIVVINMHYAVTLEVLSFWLYTCILTSLPCLEALQGIILWKFFQYYPHIVLNIVTCIMFWSSYLQFVTLLT
jgi:hypothetical protein